MSTPLIRTAGFDGYLVTFGDRLNDDNNRAALAFKGAVDAAGLDGVRETSTSLISTYLRFDPLQVSHAALKTTLTDLIDSRDWFDAGLPEGRSLWRIPAAFGGDHGPQLADAAELAGMSIDDAIASITAARVRVQTIGFAPGMPYLGELPEAWNIPRQSQLTAEVPKGGVCVAVRQLVLFPNKTPTGWRQIARTRVSLFRPDSDAPFLLKPGDEVQFQAITPEALAAIDDADPNGGAVREALT